MAGITLSQAETQLDTWLAASTAIASGRSYQIGELTVDRGSVAHVMSMIDFWERKVLSLTNGNNRATIRQVIPNYS